MSNKKIVKYIHAIQSGTICNLSCSYCYVPTLKDEQRNQPVKFNYPLKDIAKAISKERLGGMALITYVGGGETFLTDDSIELLRLFLEEGHIVNAVSNLTYTPAIEKICQFPEELRQRLQFSASFHYLELKRKNLLDTYFDNLQKLDIAGITYYINLTFCEDYVPYMDEIKDICIKKTGRNPFILYCLDANDSWKRSSIYTKEFINELIKKYDCDYLKIEDDISYGKYQNKFCYMGDWGFIYNLETGTISACFDSPATQNIVEDLSKPIKFEAVGTCCSSYCSMGARFLGLGVVPQIKDFPTYSNLYSKVKNYPKNSLVSSATDVNFSLVNKKYSKFKKIKILFSRHFDKKYKIGSWNQK